MNLYQRGQIFSNGARISFGASVVVLGLHLAFFDNVVRSLVYFVSTFLFGSLLAWCIEILFASTLEKVSLERAQSGKPDYQPVGGAAFESARPLLGGPHAPETVPPSFYGGVRGRSVDYTLPEERSVAPAPAPDPLAAARPAAAVARQGAPRPAAATLAAPAPQLPAGDDFQDLGALLRRQSAAPAAVAAPVAAPAPAVPAPPVPAPAPTAAPRAGA